MPNYEYRCTACDHVFELWQPVGEAAPSCPECGAVVKKVFHPPRVIFKGSGFYVTDLRAEKSAASSKSSESKTEAESKSDTSSSDKTSSETNSGAATKEAAPVAAATPEKTTSSDGLKPSSPPAAG